VDVALAVIAGSLPSLLSHFGALNIVLLILESFSGFITGFSLLSLFDILIIGAT
jgi:hypothetical protein